MDVQMTEEFFRALAMQAGITLHIRMIDGRNTHHQIEAMFKAFARALDSALQKDARVKGVPSTKGRLI
jgi:imidazoleglycerol-phosphate dehydratase